MYHPCCCAPHVHCHHRRPGWKPPAPAACCTKTVTVIHQKPAPVQVKTVEKKKVVHHHHHHYHEKNAPPPAYVPPPPGPGTVVPDYYALKFGQNVSPAPPPYSPNPPIAKCGHSTPVFGCTVCDGGFRW